MRSFLINSKSVNRFILKNIVTRNLVQCRYAKNVRFSTISLFIITFLFAFTISIQHVEAVPAVTFLNTPYDLNSGTIGGPATVIRVTNVDLGVNNPLVIDTIQVQISSISGVTTRDSIILTLRETGLNTGDFRNTNLVFLTGNYFFNVGDSLTLTLDDNTLDTDPAMIDNTAGSVIILSDSDSATFNPYDLTETAINSGIFTRPLIFTTSASSGNSLQVAAGDIISIIYTGGQNTNGMISPNPSPDGLKGALRAEVGDTIRATYQGVNANTVIQPYTPGGGGGGGLIRPGLVLDVVAALGGGGTAADRASPKFTLDKSSLDKLSLPKTILDNILQLNPFQPIPSVNDPLIDMPLRIADSGYPLFGYSQTIETFRTETGIPLHLKLNLSDDTGVEHIALYTNLRGTTREIGNSDTYLIYNEDKPLEIIDPHGFFSSVNFIEHESGTKYVVDFNIIFNKPMEKSDIIFRTWDEKRNSGDTKIFDAIEVTGKALIDNTIQMEKSNVLVFVIEKPHYTMPLPDSDGNISYYNSFGELEQKKIQPYHDPFVYPDNVGRSERHDDGFYNNVLLGETKAQTIVQKLVADPFEPLEEKLVRTPFDYPDNVGKLDRKYVDVLNNTMTSEFKKATKLVNEIYSIANFGD